MRDLNKGLYQLAFFITKKKHFVVFWYKHIQYPNSVEMGKRKSKVMCCSWWFESHWLELSVSLDHKCSKAMCGGFVTCQLGWAEQHFPIFLSCAWPIKMRGDGDCGAHEGQSEAAAGPACHSDMLSLFCWLFSLEGGHICTCNLRFFPRILLNFCHS